MKNLFSYLNKSYYLLDDSGYHFESDYYDELGITTVCLFNECGEEVYYTELDGDIRFDVQLNDIWERYCFEEWSKNI